MNKSIFELINDNIADGVLNRDFTLPDESKDDSAPRFAPGALDGICLFHTGPSGLDAAGAGQMAQALEQAAGGYYPNADTLFAEWTQNHRAIKIVDKLQDYVIDHSDQLDGGNILNAAMYLILRSSHIECVKIGLELLELFRISSRDSEEVKEIVRRIGQCDEFTIFAVWNMRKWENGNREVFELAKKVHGWGRIHTVAHLKPDTAEIRHWLLTEGTVNDVMNSYSSLTCWQKAQAEAVLFGHPSPEEYKGLSTLLDGLLNEGPVQGISTLENADKILLRFLEISKDYEPSSQNQDLLQAVRQWLDQIDEPK